ncbi:rhodanese-like domain-containing protein [Candidatus Fukatsuia symbiotica]|uniref:Rhodanese-like domain-containing protein n=1 Tax=Candidatus Fukatsuia symbiotica TaxID=1878942 RepID=A0A2U8I449_9GAMM|nr:rhodanese-like domain-containing protein [Candidatus Fukatsuia symbiotica]AWK13879.1 rhodanese-like domain-containing protein [Candidatus Fukatsuia symbiotica]MEA9445788.1 rhodanese-like domain-containing protein [Candidatus Fukatsuia symbiotica]
MLQEMTQFIGQHPILSLAWVALLGAVIIIMLKSCFSNVKETTRSEIIRLLNKENATVVDIRSREDYRKGHIANSINISPSDIKNGNLAELKKRKARPVVVVCATGTTAGSVAGDLNKAGFERVFILKEGISGWNRENLPLVWLKSKK